MGRRRGGGGWLVVGAIQNDGQTVNRCSGQVREILEFLELRGVWGS